ncbi:MAG: AAA family ATPase [Archangium sp.]
MERLTRGQISESDFAELRARGRLGFTRMALRNLGLISPSEQTGTWSLTQLGIRYAAARASEPIKIEPFTIAPRTEEADAVKGVETVFAHPERYYIVPILEALVSGVSQRGDLLDTVEARIKRHLTPGDRRSHASGVVVWEGRANWAISNIKAKGLIETAGSGQWRITDAGRKYLEAERATWGANEATPPRSKAAVAIELKQSPSKRDATEHRPIDALEGLRSRLGTKLIDAVTARIRPEFGATPPNDQSTKRNLILYGPPGTGKTHVARALAMAITGDSDGGDDAQFRLVQFHPSYSYEDFIQGLRPDLSSVTQLRYELQEGPFLRISQAAEDEPDSFFVLVIDEINRGDPARIFGELLFALEYRDEAVTLAQGGTLTVPPNLIIIGTMNSVDRSVALVDYALRRRFSFIRIDPDPEVIERVHGTTLLGRAGPSVLESFNEWLTSQRDADHALGHSYFLNVAFPDRADVFDRIWDLDVRPLLEEYFFGDRALLDKAAAQWKSVVASAVAEAEQ